MSEARADHSQSFWKSLPGIITAVSGLIAAIGTVFGVLVGVGVLPLGGGSAPASVPSSPANNHPSGAGQPGSIFHELQVRADPTEAGEFVLNPSPNAQRSYPEGTKVTIDVLPQRGWQVERWIGPVEDQSGLSAKIDMDSDQTVVVAFTEETPAVEKNKVFPTAFVLPTFTPIPPDIPAATNVSGLWTDILGNTLTFRVTSSGYEFTQRNAFGVAIAEGTAFFRGNLLTVNGVNVLGLTFSGLFEVTEGHMVGTTTNALGEENFIELFR